MRLFGQLKPTAVKGWPPDQEQPRFVRNENAWGAWLVRSEERDS